MDELEDEWPTGDDALTTREEVTAYYPAFRKLGGQQRKLQDHGWLTDVSRTLDFPADWLPTFRTTKVDQRHIQ